MIKLTVLYNHPDDPQAFDDHYLTTHVPLARQIPQLRRLDVAKIEQVRGGGDPPYHLIVELYYDDEESMAAALETPEYARALADQANLNSNGAVAWICRVVA